LPSEIGKLKKLKILNVSQNQIRALPEFKETRLLEELIINDNKIDNLPFSIGACDSLKVLQIHHNKIKQVPETLEKLKNLKSVNFEWFLYFDPP
jgi:Leucine-rich repeat (LRR) protein